MDGVWKHDAKRSIRRGQYFINSIVLAKQKAFHPWACTGNTKGGSTTVPLTSCMTGLDYSVLQIRTKIVSSHTADSKPVKQEVNGIVILPPLVFPGFYYKTFHGRN